MTRIFAIADLAATEAFGRRLGELLFPGAVVALVGPLGAGKTHLARAIATGLGLTRPESVTSPTFVLIQEYPARLPVYHFDAYRLAGPEEFAALGSDEYLSGDGVCLIEWADKVRPCLPPEHLWVAIDVPNEHRRRFTVTAQGRRYEELLARLDAASADRLPTNEAPASGPPAPPLS